MALQCGIVGLPNVGKSTLFNALTKAGAAAANFPFCTIDPNVGVVPVPDERLSRIAELIGSKELIPTRIEFVDIAGLVAGASKGEGLGNQFLGHIRQVDAIVHTVRCFDDPNIIHVSGSVDPARDIDIINTELMLADLDSIDKKLAKTEKVARTSKEPKVVAEYSLTKKISEALNAGKPARSVVPTEDELPFLKDLQLLTAKPVLYACNVNEEDFSKGGNPWTEVVRKRAAEENNEAIIISCALEAEIAQLEEAEQKEFLASLGTAEPGLARLIRSSYQLLKLRTYFTAGPKECRAWTIREGTKAPQAAGVIHSDFERGFIRSETYHCTDLFELKTESAIKDAGKYRSEGKDYTVRDGDVLLFRFNV